MDVYPLRDTLVACGVFAISSPIDAFIGLSTILAILILFNGFVQVAFGLQNRKTLKSWIWQFLGGSLKWFGLVLALNPSWHSNASSMLDHDPCD